MDKFVTPECEAKYIWLFKPNTKFGEVYSVTCLMDDSPEWTQLIEKITGLHEEYYAAQCSILKKKNLKKCPYLPWKTEDGGKKVFVAKNNATGVKKDGTTFACKPQVFDPERNPITEEDLMGELGNGTRLRVGFTVNLWTNDAQGCGVSARLNFAQIITPVYYNPFDGFTDVKGEGLKAYKKDDSLFKKAAEKMTGQDKEEFTSLFDIAN